MARKQSRIHKTVLPIKTDDFSLIKGIGPVIAGRLYAAGVCTYDQLASLSPAKMAEMVTGMSAKQISKQDWSGQALKLSTKKTESKLSQKDSPKQSINQHYENFTIEFLVDEKHAVRRTRVIHIQGGDADTWAGWEADQLIDFLARHTGIHLPAKKIEKKESLPLHITPPNNIRPEPVPAIVKIAEPKTQLPDIPTASQAVSEVMLPVLQPVNNSDYAGTLRMYDFCILPIGANAPVRSLHSGQPCQARITLDLSAVAAPNDLPLQYKVTISFKQLGGGSYPGAEESNPIKRSGCITLNIACTTPPPGLYRPVVLVKVFSNETAPGLMAAVKGELIQFF